MQISNPIVFEIIGTLGNLNEWIKKMNRHRMLGHSYKKEYQEIVEYAIKDARIHSLQLETPYFFEYSFYMGSKKLDKDNYESFCKKVILDALQVMGTIKQDNWNAVSGNESKFFLDREYPRIEVKIHHGYKEKEIS